MFCEKCGAKNDSSDKFCEKCGNRLEAEVQETKKNTKAAKENNTSLKEKINTLSKKQKIIGGIVLAVLVIIIVLYIVGSKMTSLETIGSKAFEELSEKSTINNKYLSVSLNSEEYFVSLGDTMKETIEEEDINFDYKNYTINAGTKKITVRYRDTEDDEQYKVVFEVKKDGKSLLLFDKYVITKITIEAEDSYGSTVLYDPENTENLTLTTIKDSKITIDGKEVSKDYIDSKKSDDKNDVYVIKGVVNGSYEVKFSLGKLSFEKTVYVYKDSDNEYNLTNYISYSYMSDDTKNFVKTFKTYISTYYEYVNDANKTVEDFDKKYKLTDDIKKVFADSKEYMVNVASFKIDDVTVRSLYYSSDDELVVTYKVNYTYKLIDSEEERTSYDNVKVRYDLSNIELPKDLDDMPY